VPVGYWDPLKPTKLLPIFISLLKDMAIVSVVIRESGIFPYVSPDTVSLLETGAHTDHQGKPTQPISVLCVECCLTFGSRKC
jgi:hypothetical protein